VRHLLLLCSLLLLKIWDLFFCWGWIVLNLFLNFEQKRASCSYKIFLIKKVVSENKALFAAVCSSFKNRGHYFIFANSLTALFLLILSQFCQFPSLKNWINFILFRYFHQYFGFVIFSSLFCFCLNFIKAEQNTIAISISENSPWRINILMIFF